MRLHTEHPDPATQLVRVVGDLEGEDAALLADAFARASMRPPPRRIIDLTELTFIDSQGLSALVDVRNATVAAGGELVLVLDPGAYARHLLEVRGLLDQFRIVATRADALAA